ncbi:MAG: sensor domain-containing diguanylate cyclase [Treponema sp.]|nr:sensor domain-containing diguanylate cyclase [Treponema sp.]
MDKEETDGDIERAFFSDPKISENLGLLEEIGVLSHVNGFIGRMKGYGTLFSIGTDLFNCAGIDDILEATVRRLSDFYLPSFITILWKPVQTCADITVRSYRNYEPVNLHINLHNITRFESFFCNFHGPIPFAELEEKLGDDAALAPLREARPEIVVPIIGPFGLYGIVLVGRRATGGDYTGEDMAFLQKFMVFVSQAIKTNLYYENSLRDIKTGLYNHGFFMTRVKEEIARTNRGFCTSSIIMIDVDKFKDFNDIYGHLAGDRVLEQLAKVIRQNVRTDDIPSRFGGEEFTVLLPKAESDVAYLVAERLRVSVSKMQVSWEKPLPPITISLGVCSFGHGCDLETNDIIRRADEALYASKAKGRNCTTLWEAGLKCGDPGKAEGD